MCDVFIKIKQHKLNINELKKKLGYPKALKGIFVIEVTLSAAKSGMLAGDIVVAVEEQKVKDLPK